MSRITPVHYLIANKILEMMSKGTYARQSQERMDGLIYSNTKTMNESFFIKQEIAVVDNTIYDDISITSLKLLAQIQQDLKVNNPLWYCETSKSQVKAAIAQLKHKDILEHLGNNIYMVNAEKIRRGKPLASLVAFYIYCRRNEERDHTWRLSVNDIIDLKPPTQQEIHEIGIANFNSRPTIVTRVDTSKMNNQEFIRYIDSLDDDSMLTDEEIIRYNILNRVDDM